MDATRKPTSRRWSWKRTVALIVFVVLAAVATLVAVPALLPEAVLRREVEAALSAQLGRPVTIDGATFRWSRGLHATGVRVGRRGEEGETPLATIRSLAIRFDPLDAAPSLAGGDLPLESVRIEGLELWLVLDREGRTNVQDLAERKPLEVHSIQVTDARIHVENRRLGQSVTVENVNASVGQLAGSGHGYVSVSAELAGERPGRFVVTANLDRLEFGGEKPPVASIKADWTDLAWPALCAMITDDADLAARLGRTSGHMTVNFDRGGWSAEGAVEAAGLTLGPWGPLGRATIAEAILGFQVRQKAAEAPLEILLARFSAPGIDLRVFRRPSKPDEPLPPPPHLRLVKAPDGRWALKEADLHATGTVTWVPLCQSIPALGDLAGRFEQMGGKARVVLDVEPAGGGHAVTASADLTDMLMIREGTIRKEEHQTLRLKVKAACAGDFGSVRASQVELVTETARLNVEGDLPLPMPTATAAAPEAPASADGPGAEAPAPADGPAAWLAGARFSAVAHVESVETLLEMVPALRGPLGTVTATGPLTWELYCSPSDAADLPAGSPPTWDVKVRGDLTKTRVAAPDGVRKDADRPATLALQARVAPGARRVDVGRAAVTLD
ncbi:MAG: hypothetical protein IMZ66_00315, partial [Planctomycetes bacterium]|nr:hypothetical protein [Planctomycetota bacterium]